MHIIDKVYTFGNNITYNDCSASLSLLSLKTNIWVYVLLTHTHLNTHTIFLLHSDYLPFLIKICNTISNNVVNYAYIEVQARLFRKTLPVAKWFSLCDEHSTIRLAEQYINLSADNYYNCRGQSHPPRSPKQKPFRPIVLVVRSCWPSTRKITALFARQLQQCSRKTNRYLLWLLLLLPQQK